MCLQTGGVELEEELRDGKYLGVKDVSQHVAHLSLRAFPLPT